MDDPLRMYTNREAASEAPKPHHGRLCRRADDRSGDGTVAPGLLCLLPSSHLAHARAVQREGTTSITLLTPLSRVTT